jgi:saccharopine dehydrogenase-like NADP-dependent oxidoreductase
MRILLVGAGGVGTAAVGIAARRDFFEHCVVTDYDLARAERAVPAGDPRFSAARIDASSAASVTDLCREHRITHVFNAVDPRFVMPIFQGAFAADAHYLDMAMSLSKPHETEPYAKVGVKLGDEQFAAGEKWAAAGLLALVGIGVEPGLSDIFARYAADTLFSRVDEVGVADAAGLHRHDRLARTGIRDEDRLHGDGLALLAGDDATHLVRHGGPLSLGEPTLLLAQTPR